MISSHLCHALFRAVLKTKMSYYLCDKISPPIEASANSNMYPAKNSRVAPLSLDKNVGTR